MVFSQRQDIAREQAARNSSNPTLQHQQGKVQAVRGVSAQARRNCRGKESEMIDRIYDGQDPGLIRQGAYNLNKIRRISERKSSDKYHP